MIDQINQKAKDLKDQGHNPTHVIFDSASYEEFKRDFYPEDRVVDGVGQPSEAPQGTGVATIKTEVGELGIVVVPSEKKFGFQIGFSF